MSKGVAVLGSTGSIGVSTLDVIAADPERFHVVALAAGRNRDLLDQQIRHHRPRLVAISDASAAAELRARHPGLEVVVGREGTIAVATASGAEVVVGGIVGAAGLPACVAALEQGRTLALANKETLVVAGEAVKAAARRGGGTILPVDSEHNAIHQALRGGRANEVERIILTASGGPFRTRPLASFGAITIADALAHPTWKMGPKITIDSATMMNKGLEVIEAHFLFDLPDERIDVVVHPQSTIHSMVEFIDGSILAQIGINDMRFPILYALSYPQRLPTRIGRLDFSAARSLELHPVETERYPAVGLARAALRAGGSAPAALNAANEVAVQAFLDGRLSFLGITAVVREVLDGHRPQAVDSVAAALAFDEDARARADEAIGRLAA